MDYATTDMGFAGVLLSLGFHISNADAANMDRIIFHFAVPAERKAEVDKIQESYEQGSYFGVDALTLHMNLTRVKKLIKTLSNRVKK